MKRYTFCVEATSVSGNQTYYVDAESEDEAREVVEGGGGEFVCEELEVQDLGEFELVDVEDVPVEQPDAAPRLPNTMTSTQAVGEPVDFAPLTAERRNAIVASVDQKYGESIRAAVDLAFSAPTTGSAPDSIPYQVQCKACGHLDYCAAPASPVASVLTDERITGLAEAFGDYEEGYVTFEHCDLLDFARALATQSDRAVGMAMTNEQGEKYGALLDSSIPDRTPLYAAQLVNTVIDVHHDPSWQEGYKEGYDDAEIVYKAAGVETFENTQGADARPVAMDEDDYVIKRLSGVLAEVSAALFGEKADGDAAELLAKLPERAQTLMLEVELYRSGVPCESCGWVLGSSVKSVLKTNKADMNSGSAPVFTVSGNFVRGPDMAFELPSVEKASKTADNLNALYATPSESPNQWADLWYFVMDEAPIEFERIVTTVSPTQWHSEAHKLMRAKYPIAQDEIRALKSQQDAAIEGDGS